MNDSSAFKTVQKMYVDTEVCLKPAEALTLTEKTGNISYECKAAHDFLELLFFSVPVSREATKTSVGNIFFKINSSKLTGSYLKK